LPRGALDPIARETTRRIRDTITSVLTPAGEKLGKARFLVYGKDAYPDATFTLRLSYGAVQGYPCNGTIARLSPRSTGFTIAPQALATRRPST